MIDQDLQEKIDKHAIEYCGAGYTYHRQIYKEGYMQALKDTREDIENSSKNILKKLFICLVFIISGCSSCNQPRCFKYDKIKIIRNCNGVGVCEIVTESGHTDTASRPSVGWPVCISE